MSPSSFLLLRRRHSHDTTTPRPCGPMARRLAWMRVWGHEKGGKAAGVLLAGLGFLVCRRGLGGRRQRGTHTPKVSLVGRPWVGALGAPRTSRRAAAGGGAPHDHGGWVEAGEARCVGGASVCMAPREFQTRREGWGSGAALPKEKVTSPDLWWVEALFTALSHGRAAQRRTRLSGCPPSGFCVLACHPGPAHKATHKKRKNEQWAACLLSRMNEGREHKGQRGRKA